MNVIVVGGGPAGLSAALCAAKQGHQVSLFEKNGCFGEKPCGEAMPKIGLNYIPKLSTQDFIENH